MRQSGRSGSGIVATLRIHHARQRLEACADLLEADRSKVPRIDADIAALPVTGKLSVRVAVKMEGAAALPRPDAKAVMTAADENIIDLHVPDLWLDARPPKRERASIIVISRDEEMRAVQLAKDRAQPPRLAAVRKISDMDYAIAAIDDRVVGVNHVIIHLAYAREWTQRKPDDRFVTEMLVSSKKRFHAGYSLHIATVCLAVQFIARTFEILAASGGSRRLGARMPAIQPTSLRAAAHDGNRWRGGGSSPQSSYLNVLQLSINV